MIFEIGERILVLGRVVTCDSHVGNGIEYLKMLAEDEEGLRRYLKVKWDISESH